MTENRFWNLLAKKMAKEASEEDLHELELLIKNNPSWIYPAEVLENLWKLSQERDKTYDAEIAFDLHLNELKKEGVAFEKLERSVPTPDISYPVLVKKNRRYRLLTYSFSSVFLVLFAFFIWRKPLKPATPVTAFKKTPSEIRSRLGSTTVLVLPDSSVVTLNAGSRLTYDENFGTTNRNTTLVGEAYFDVKKSTTPFIIHANGLRIKVLGTTFNVKSYPNEKTTETTLIRGRVEITHEKRPGEVFILNPNEKLTIANEPEQNDAVLVNNQLKVLKTNLTHTWDNSILETSWVENKLIFQDESFQDVARKMERRYNVVIEIKDPKLAEMHVGGGPFENETIQQALIALQIAFNFHFTMEGNHIIITR